MEAPGGGGPTDTTAQNVHGETAADVAECQGDDVCTNLLRSHGKGPDEGNLGDGGGGEGASRRQKGGRGSLVKAAGVKKCRRPKVVRR
jgi:hypothetical protein